MTALKVFYIAQNKPHLFQNGTDIEFSGEAVERYKRNMRTVEMQKSWKQGHQEELLHALSRGEEDRLPYVYNGLSVSEDRRSLIYSILIDECSGIYEKQQLRSPTEAVILSDNRHEISQIYCNGSEFLATISETGSPEKHIGKFSFGSPDILFLTEGDCIDSYPFYSRKHPGEIYFTTSGIGRDIYENIVALGPRYISKLSLSTMEQEELYCDEKWDYYKAKDDAAGNLYYIRRPYQAKKPRESIFFTIIAAPFRLLRAIGGALNYFSLRYSGQSLRSGGSNPVKTKNKSERELFIEGNYINAARELRRNSSSNEKNPGIIPRNWELWRRTPAGEESCIKKGVYDYDVSPEGKIVFSNGRHIFFRDTSGTEQVLQKAELASSLLITDLELEI